MKTTQCKAARALLDWDLETLSKRSGINIGTISAFERSASNPKSETIYALRKALEEGGVELLPDGGVRPRQNRVLTLQGREGFAEFRSDVLHDAQMGPLDVCVSNVDEAQFDKWGAGKVNDAYFSAMEQVQGLSFRILVKEKDINLTASKYADYRWLPAHLFGEISFYVYGNKVAIISFKKDDFNAFVICHDEIADFYRKDFDRLWGQAYEVTQTEG